MPVLVNADTKLICQGITGSFGAQHARACFLYGTDLVGGVTPGKGGQSFEIDQHRTSSLTPKMSSARRPQNCPTRYAARRLKSVATRAATMIGTDATQKATHFATLRKKPGRSTPPS
jgi:hypothetical protein